MKMRVLRVLEYVGTAEQITAAMHLRGIKGSFNANGMQIREAIIGEIGEIIEEAQPGGANYGA